jgi:hypothetical protein
LEDFVVHMSRKLAILLVIAAVAVFPHASLRATAAARSGVSAERVYELDIAGIASTLGGTPDAVVLNVTATRTRKPGFVTVFPCGADRPVASNLNFTTANTVPNLVVSKVGSNGKVCAYASQALDLVIDINGWFPSGSGYRAITPDRVLDTRGGLKLAAGVPTALVLRGARSVPESASAALLNVTVTDPVATGFVTVYACDQAVPVASNLNFVAGQTVPNAVVAPLSANGSACFVSSVDTHLLVDVDGAFTGVGDFAPRSPIRLLDTRKTGTPAADQIVEVSITSAVGNAGAIVANVTATNPAAAGFVTVFPCGDAVPTASNLNMATGQTVPNLVFARVGAGGRICLKSTATTDLLVDVVGGFPAGSTYRSARPPRLLDTRSLPVPNPAGVMPLPAMPPGGVYDGNRPPQLVLLSFDGAGSLTQLDRWRSVAAKAPARFTFFLSSTFLLSQQTKLNYQPPRAKAGSSAIGFAPVPDGQSGAQWIPALVDKLHTVEDEGHEIGTHYAGHFCGPTGVSSWNANDWRAELDQVDKLADNAGPNNGAAVVQSPHRNGIVGGRTPCLEGKFDQLYPVLVERGFRYDASAVRYEADWPKAKTGNLWQFGAPTIPIAGRQLLAGDYTIWKNLTGAYSELRQQVREGYLAYFDRRYYGNRAPVELAGHTKQLADGAFLDAMGDVAIEVCGKPEVQCITYEEAVAWLDQHAGDIAAFERGSFTKKVR